MLFVVIKSSNGILNGTQIHLLGQFGLGFLLFFFSCLGGTGQLLMLLLLAINVTTFMEKNSHISEYMVLSSVS